MSKLSALQQISAKLGWGGGKLKGPGKAARNPVARVLSLLAPPVTVQSFVSPDEEWATFDGYLVTFNEAGSMTKPPNHETLWGGAEAAIATEKTLKKYAKRTLGGMFVEGLCRSARR